MASEPNRYDDFLRRQRAQTPPAQIAADIERNVMGRILSKSPPHKILRLKWAVVSVVASLLLVVSVLAVRHRAAVQFTPKNNAFEESVVILDDGHVCIWLEPVDSNPRKAAP